MTYIAVYTDKGQQVASMQVDDTWSPSTVARKVAGIQGLLHGWIDRALSDARVIEAGGDPERPSEKVMRLLSVRRDVKH